MTCHKDVQMTINSPRSHAFHIIGIVCCLIVAAVLNTDKLVSAPVKGSVHTVLLSMLLYGILRGLSFSNTVRFIFALILSIEFFVQLSYQSSLTISIVMSIINAPLGESASFASQYFAQILLAAVICIILTLFTFTGPKIFGVWMTGVGVAYLLLPFLIKMPGVYSDAFYEDYVDKGTSRGNSEVFSAVEYTFHKISLRFPPFESAIAVVDSINLLNMQVELTSSWSEVSSKPEAADVLVIGIGESLRSGNMGLYGYSRNTTPQLSSIQSQLTIHYNTYAAGANTWSSIPAAMTKTGALPDLSKSVIHLANDAGYETYWLSNQAEFGQWDFSITSLAKQAEHAYFTAQDEGGSQLDDVLYGKLKQTLSHPGVKKLIILHFYGSHMAFSDRYDESFSVFESENRDLDEYDNSVLYTDYWQAKFIQLVSDNGGKYLFFSDHGLGHPEGDMALKHDVRTPPDIESLKVPLFMTKDNSIEIPNDHPVSLFYFECLFSEWSGITALELQQDNYCDGKLISEEVKYLDSNMSTRTSQVPVL